MGFDYKNPENWYSVTLAQLTKANKVLPRHCHVTATSQCLPKTKQHNKPNQTKPNQTKPNQTKPNHGSKFTFFLLLPTKIHNNNEIKKGKNCK
jgi:hypothetical protein